MINIIRSFNNLLNIKQIETQLKQFKKNELGQLEDRLSKDTKLMKVKPNRNQRIYKHKKNWLVQKRELRKPQILKKNLKIQKKNIRQSLQSIKIQIRKITQKENNQKVNFKKQNNLNEKSI
ncbi:unnamed protein product [Paramecium sonneborni]|uniref:Uncharacterized protein n=1 Tax=Paramecium sonneborni TaxID=65129 RepID=A0A8S1JV38_9CILI|nr:unnamed protein product [Paramecium sonneborni]